MKLLILFFFLNGLLLNYSYSQTLNPDESLINGFKYKSILFEENRIAGTLVLQNINKNRYILMTEERNNSYLMSKDISPSGYKFLATLNSGTIPNSSDYGDYRSNFIINARFSYFYSDNINVGIDISYTPFKEDSYDYAYDFEDGAKETYTDIIVNAQYGTFDESNIVDLYLNLGTGMHIFHRSSYSSSYYSFNDSGYYTYYNKPYTRLYPLFQIGAGLIIKPSYNFGINIEADMQAYGFGYFFIPVEASFPIKAGLTYYFMK